MLLLALLVAASNADRVIATHELIATAKADHLADEREWRLLLHTEPGDDVSAADSPSFFLSPEGKHDPEAELFADIAAFLAPIGDNLDGTPYCTFPARFRYLDGKLGLVARGAPTPECPAYIKWRTFLAPTGLTMIFASAFLNSPASMFGHTMMRIEKGDAQGNALLSTIINYAAYPTTTNPFAYTVLGLTGGFPGRFSALPYYVKVQEYSNMEARDLYEYPLALTDDEIDRLLMNVWELDQTHFDYFFLSENCSYHLLSLLEVARPSLHLREHFPAHAIPIDTMKVVLDQVGLASPPVFRPSATLQMKARYKLLTDDEADLAKHLARDEVLPTDELHALPPERQAIVLDAADDYLKYKFGVKLGRDLDPSRTERKREWALIRERGRVQAPPYELEVTPPTKPPETAHETMRVGAGFGVTNTGQLFGEITWRGSLHDFLDRQDGYVPSSWVEMPVIKLRLRPDRIGDSDGASSVVLDQADFVRIVSLTPKDGWVNLPSWRVAVGAERLRDLDNCDRWKCVAGALNGGIGYALQSHVLGGEIWYGFFDLNVWAGPQLHPNFRIAPDVALGTAMQVTPFWRNAIEAKLRFDALGDTRAGRWVPMVELGESFATSKNSALRLRGALWRDVTEAALDFYVYY